MINFGDAVFAREFGLYIAHVLGALLIAWLVVQLFSRSRDRIGIWIEKRKNKTMCDIFALFCDNDCPENEIENYMKLCPRGKRTQLRNYLTSACGSHRKIRETNWTRLFKYMNDAISFKL